MEMCMSLQLTKMGENLLRKCGQFFFSFHDPAVGTAFSTKFQAVGNFSPALYALHLFPSINFQRLQGFRELVLR